VSADVEINSEGLRRWTQGLNERGAHDLLLEVADASLLPEAEALLRNLADYMTSNGVQVKAEETLVYGYWAMKVTDGKAGRVELCVEQFMVFRGARFKVVQGVSSRCLSWARQSGLSRRYSTTRRRGAPTSHT
jgi:hypothetical protein